MKYIIFKNNNGDEIAVIFHHMLIHKSMADHVTHMARRDGLGDDWKPIAAGFYSHEGQCYGESESLKLKSRGSQDEYVIKNPVTPFL